jgi:hypothetical protein
VDETRWERYGLAAGIAFVALVVIAAVIGGSPPRPTDGALKVAGYFQDHQDALKVGSYLEGLGAVAFLWFLGALWARLRRAEGTGGRVSVVALVGGIGTFALAFVGNGIDAFLALYVRDISPFSTKIYYLLAVIFLAFASFTLAVFVSAVSVLILRHGFVDRRLGWVGEGLALLWLVAGVGVADDNTFTFAVGFVAFLVWAVWILVLVVLLLTRPAPARTAS